MLSSRWYIVPLLTTCVVTVAALKRPTTRQDNLDCRFLPGDDGWPRENQWAQLNTSVSGRLIATVPKGYVCHEPTYNATACESLQASFLLPQAHFDSPSGFMSPFFQNATCDPYTNRSEPCLLGNYVEYAINVTAVDDVKAGLSFAQEKNIRLVIKNTGHDYAGKSTGAGALSLWMHNLKNIKFLTYTGHGHRGPAIKMGAGVQAFEAYTAADQVGLNVVGGECPTIGLAGGFSQGGGHSILSSVYGLGADQTLEWEVVTANGTHLIATTTQNSDLYWALSGGGGGTYAVVLSLTSKAYPNKQVGGASLSFQATSVEDDALWKAVAFFQQKALPRIIGRGAHVQWAVLGPTFIITEASILGATVDDMRNAFLPFTNYLQGKRIPYEMNVTCSATFYEHVEKYLGPLPYGMIPGSQILGGAMISRATVDTKTADLVSILRHLSTKYPKWFFSSYALDVSKASRPPNAVLPAWRDMLSYFVITHNWNYTSPIAVERDQERILTEELMPPFRRLASGAYLNEGDFNNPKWREDYYGSNWDRLLEIKQKWDPMSLLYARTAVGSDAWLEAGDGRLCRADL